MISRGLFVSARQCSSYKSQIALKHLSQSQLGRTLFRKYFLCLRLALNSRNYVPSRPEGSPGWVLFGPIFGPPAANFTQPRFESTESLDASIQGRCIEIHISNMYPTDFWVATTKGASESELSRQRGEVTSPGSSYLYF